MKKKERRMFLLGEGFPWYFSDPSKEMDDPYSAIKLKQYRNGGGKAIQLNGRYGAYRKVRLWIEATE
jgi:hypothetical protein